MVAKRLVDWNQKHPQPMCQHRWEHVTVIVRTNAMGFPHYTRNEKGREAVKVFSVGTPVPPVGNVAKSENKATTYANGRIQRN